MMKRFRPYFSAALFFCAAVTLTACGQKETAVTETTEAVSETAEQTEAQTEAVTAAIDETMTVTEMETTGETETETETEAAGPIVCIDAGHQGPGQDMSGTEPNAPGSDVMKARIVSGTSGCISGLDEYELNLQVSLKLKEELLNRGYQVVMTRETDDVNISNIDRCEIASEAGADIMVRIHANGSDDSTISGALTMAPSEENPYTTAIFEESERLASDILDAYCQATGFANCNILYTDEMTGINWSEIPVTILEMGFMTNEYDDAYMADESNQYIMAEGIANGIDTYFGR